MQANRSLINFGLVRIISKAQNKVSVTDKVTLIIKIICGVCELAQYLTLLFL